MSISENLINRLNSETGQRLLDVARAGRKRALSLITKCCVVVTDDGYQTREVVFASTPTLRQLMDRVGGEVFVVSVQMRRITHRERVTFQVAAE